MLPVGWSLLVPLKALPRAKTRLRGALAGVGHERLVVALALSTVRAAQRADGVQEVIVVTGDQRLRRELTPFGVRFADDAGSLNGSLVLAAAALAGRSVAALTGDVPALRPVELAEALALADVRSFVPDRPGVGTVLLAAPAGEPLRPQFGPDSAYAHAQSGAKRLDGVWPTLRRDVDTAADLEEAVNLGWKLDLS
ncbi:MAG: 2-phospho-L-lactate guanylyltransferase [Hamadaea sp.]|uniref:2-phospho-L-lactate guanylyltransferase n=1 Tax=Hamadaea sp. TaxID=2024425 RepID=UPI001795670E|nr:2-phospho-L-lactate guanylyltransferase [Hamadaea sp.]NUR70217.1 2-phospho-L-lactate guanylyltransferase [Hamadaea sp.]NUT21870.1 2-phospho-L-lactate guanylyltransferase [Hamadaea sp.]